MKNEALSGFLKECFQDKVEFTTAELVSCLTKLKPDLSKSTISWRISQLKKEGYLFQRGRGIYSFDFMPEYEIEFSLKSKRSYNKIKGLYSGDIVMWDTNLIEEISGQKLSKYWLFLAINKDDIDSLFNEMLSFSKKVFAQPDKETVKRYLLPQDEAIILTPSISEMPVQESGDYLAPTIESVLVNTWFDYELYMKDIGLDIAKMYKYSFGRYSVNKSRMLRYASRRDKRKEINNLLKAANNG